MKQWKLSPVDAKASKLWSQYSNMRNLLFAHTHAPLSPWTVVRANHKHRARLNLIRDLLSRLDYKGRQERLLAVEPHDRLSL